MLRTPSFALALALLTAAALLPVRPAAAGADRGFAEAPPVLTPAARARIELRLREARLDPARFALEPLAGWPQRRLHLVVANPTQDKVADAPLFAVLTDGAVVMAGDPDAFRMLVARAFPAPRRADAAQLAELAVRFGAYGRPVGSFVSKLPAAVRGTKVPRPDARPALARRAGVTTLDHYAYDFDRQQLFDCHVELGPGGAATGSCKPVP